MQQCAGAARRPLSAQAPQVPLPPFAVTKALLSLCSVLHPLMCSRALWLACLVHPGSLLQALWALGKHRLQQPHQPCANKLRQGHLPILRAAEACPLVLPQGAWRSGTGGGRGSLSCGPQSPGASQAAEHWTLHRCGNPLQRSLPRSAALFSPGCCLQKHRAEPQLRRPNLLGRLSQRSAGRCMGTSPSSLQDCVLKHALLVMQGLGPLMHSLLPTVQADAEQPFPAMQLLCIHTS